MKDTNFTKLWHWASYAGLVAIGIYVLYTILVFAFPPDVVKYNVPEQKILNENKVVKRLDDVVILVDFCKYLPYKAIESETHLEDGVIWDLPSSIIPQETGCRKQELRIKIPKEIPTGEKLRIRKEYYFQVSFLLPPVKEEWVSEQFTVTE